MTIIFKVSLRLLIFLAVSHPNSRPLPWQTIVPVPVASVVQARVVASVATESTPLHHVMAKVARPENTDANANTISLVHYLNKQEHRYCFKHIL